MFVEEWEACEVAKKSINKRMKDEKWAWQTHVVMFVGKRYFVVTSLRWAIFQQLEDQQNGNETNT